MKMKNPFVGKPALKLAGGYSSPRWVLLLISALWLQITAAQAQTVPYGHISITLANGTAINGPIALPPNGTITLRLLLSSNTGSTLPPVWGWMHNPNVDVTTINERFNATLIPGSVGSSTVTINQPGTYYVTTEPSPQTPRVVTCDCTGQVVEVILGQGLNGQPLNYTKETTVLKPGVSASGLATLAPAEQSQNSTLVDGFGRTLQSIHHKAAPDQSDVLAFQQYDPFGQASTTYLPYTHTPAGTTFPFSTSPTSEQATFYTTSPKIAADGHPYATATMESSPLARTIAATKPGSDWQAHPTTQSFGSNAANEVRQWNDLDGSNFYPAKSLTRESTQGADGQRADLYRDLEGRTVLQRQWNSQTAHDTYTVYNAIGQVRYVISPAAVIAGAALGYNLTDPDFPERWLYRYEYDEQGRLISRGFPGAKPLEMVYDRLDRLILTQDGNGHRDGRWLFTKYDAMGRAVVEGVLNSGSTRAALQTAADAWTGALYEQRRAGGCGYYTAGAYPQIGDGMNGRVLSATVYDDYDLNLDGTPDFAYLSQGLAADEPEPTNLTQGQVTVIQRRIVKADGSYGDWLTTVSFYDAHGNVVQAQTNSHLVPGTALPNVTTLIYQNHGFVPQILRSIKTQNSPTHGTVEVRNRFAYDHAGRLQKVWQQNTWRGGADPQEVLVASYSYNALGQLVEKNLHSRDEGASFLQSVDLRYDIQGALRSINNSALTPDGVLNDDTNDVFGLELVRQHQDAALANAPLFDGGISAVRWQAHNPRQQHQPERQRSYAFTYDGLGRLTAADYAASNSGGVTFTEEVNAYNEKDIAYDANGNIKTLRRNSQASAEALSKKGIDLLTYTYVGNQLQAVNDDADANVGFRDGAHSSHEYTYDPNGSIIADANKQTGFTYNVLNKVAVQVIPKGQTEYVYDAAGALLQRTVITNATGARQVFDYVDGFVYTTDTKYTGLSSVPTVEGRAVVLTTPAEKATDAEEPIGGGIVANGDIRTELPAAQLGPAAQERMVYEYHLRDQLGNLRVAFRAEELQEHQSLCLEQVNREEGPYPRFEGVSSSQSDDYAYEGKHSAAVWAGHPGPSTRIPVKGGDHVKVDLFYLTPAGVQSYRPAAPANMLPKAVALVLAPMVLTAPQTGDQHRNAQSLTWPVLGVQLGWSGLLSRLFHPASTPSGTTAIVEPGPIGPGSDESHDAYVSWTLYDSEDQEVSNGRAVVRVKSDNDKDWSHFDTTILVDDRVQNNGYLQVALLNDGAKPVYFDSVSIRHPREGLLVSQENHYYPFGMSLSGVAVNTTAQPQASKNQYNGGSELQDELLDSEQGIYSTFYRNYDPATGRFQGVDPLADEYADSSPYSFALNDPITFNDPNGDDPVVRQGNNFTINWNEVGDFGGSWSSARGGIYTGFDSSIEAFYAGAAYLDRFSAWGTCKGGAKNFESGATAFSNGGKESIPLREVTSREVQTNPLWLQWRIAEHYSQEGYASRMLDLLQNGLDGVGLIPGYGEAADGINAGIYGLRGDKVNAGLSVAAMLPIVGMAATGGRILRKVGIQVHHVIPNAVFRKLASNFPSGWLQNAGANLKKLPTPFHGNHPQYNRYVSDKIQELMKKGTFDLNSAKNLVHDLRQEINKAYDAYKQGGGNLNDQFRSK